MSKLFENVPLYMYKCIYTYIRNLYIYTQIYLILKISVG